MRILDLLARAAGLAALWLVVSEGRWEYWYYGVLTVVAATAASIAALPLRRARPPGPRRVAAGVALAGWMLWRMLLGAVDVARRALGPDHLVDAHEQRLPAHLPPGRGGVLATVLSCLLPGSLVHRVDEQSVAMHVLAPDIDAEGSWAALNRRIARL